MAEVRVEGQPRNFIDYTGGTTYLQTPEPAVEQGTNKPDLISDLKCILDLKASDVSLHQLARVLRDINFFQLDVELKNRLTNFISERFNQTPEAISSEAVSMSYKSRVAELCSLTDEHFAALNTSIRSLEYYANHPYSRGVNSYSHFEVTIFGEPELREYISIKGDRIITALIKRSFINPNGQLFLPNCYYILELTDKVANNIRATSIRRFISQHLDEILEYFRTLNSSILTGTKARFLEELFKDLYLYTDKPQARNLMYQCSNTRIKTEDDLELQEEQLLEQISLSPKELSIQGPIQIYFDREAKISEQ
jgi:hypothetical protein